MTVKQNHNDNENAAEIEEETNTACSTFDKISDRKPNKEQRRPTEMIEKPD